MTDNSAAHQQAVKQLGEARDRALEYLQLLSAENNPGDDRRTVPVGQTPTALTEANSAVKSLLLQIHPYRDKTDRWNTDLGQIRVQSVKRSATTGRGRQLAAHKELVDHPRAISLDSLGDVADIANREVVYQPPVTSDRGGGTGAERHLIVLRTAELQRVLQLADDCLGELDMLATVTESGGASFSYEDLLWDDDSDADQEVPADG